MRLGSFASQGSLLLAYRGFEVIYTYWSDVNLAEATVRMSHKADRGWSPKAYKEGEIPIPAKLVKNLKAWKGRADKACKGVLSIQKRRKKG